MTKNSNIIRKKKKQRRRSKFGSLYANQIIIIVFFSLSSKCDARIPARRCKRQKENRQIVTWYFDHFLRRPAFVFQPNIKAASVRRRCTSRMRLGQWTPSSDDELNSMRVFRFFFKSSSSLCGPIRQLMQFRC